MSNQIEIKTREQMVAVEKAIADTYEDGTSNKAILQQNENGNITVQGYNDRPEVELPRIFICFPDGDVR